MRKGQALIIVLLLLAVLVSVGLSVVSRSVTEVSLSNTEDESSRALSAAEAGVEGVLNKTITAPVNSSVGSGADESYSVGTFDNNAGGGPKLTLPDLLKSGETATVYLTGLGTPTHMATDIDICWGDPGLTANPGPALQAAVFYQVGLAYHVSRLVWDPANQINGRTTPLYSGANNCPTDRSYKSMARTKLSSFGIPAGSTLRFMRLTLLHNNTESHYISLGTPVPAAGPPPLPFPAQGTSAPVIGKAGQSSKQIQVFERTPEPLPIFDNALFAGGNIL